MNTLTLCRLACSDPRIKKGFGGVRASDDLPSKKGIFKSFIINLDPKHLPGSHWVAIYFRNDVAFYFDSFGQRPQNRDIITFLRENAKNIRCNAHGFQNFNTFTCGHFCLYFLHQSHRNLKLRDLDPTNRKKNEHFIKYFVNARFKLEDCCASLHGGGRQTCRALINVTQSTD